MQYRKACEIFVGRAAFVICRHPIVSLCETADSRRLDADRRGIFCVSLRKVSVNLRVCEANKGEDIVCAPSDRGTKHS